MLLINVYPISVSPVLSNLSRMRLSLLLITLGLGLVSALGDLNDFNTDQQTIAPERIAAFYSDIVIKGE